VRRAFYNTGRHGYPIQRCKFVFPEFGDEVEYNPDLSYSLVRCVIKPDSYDINSCRINDNLFVTTLAYSISSKDKLLEIIDLKKLSAFINFLRLKFNVV